MSSPTTSSKVKHHDPQISRRWMTFLAQHENSNHVFPHASMIQIPMLGVHDAGTFGIHSTSELAADLPEVLKKLPRFLNVTARRHIATWSKTQHLNLFQQMDRYGCRYFDLRVCPHFGIVDNNSSNNGNTDSAPVSIGAPFTLWLTHGSFSLPLEAGLDQIVAFLESKKRCDHHHQSHHHHHHQSDHHTTTKNDDYKVETTKHEQNDDLEVHQGENLETFVLDLQRISGFSESRHYVKLAELLHSKLGKYLVPRRFDLTTPLKVLWENGWRVFLLAQKDGIEYLDKALELVACGAADTSAMASPKAPLPPTEAEAAQVCDITPPPPPPPRKEVEIDSKSSIESGMETEETIQKKEVDGEIELPLASEKTKSIETLRVNIVACLHPRNPLVIRSHWFNQRYKQELAQKLEWELVQRSKTFCDERCQLHVLQAILTPTASDMLVAFGTGGSGKESPLSDCGDLNDAHFSEAEQKEYNKRHSILDFAKQINSDLITLWEDETRWTSSAQLLKNDEFFVFKSVDDLKRSRPNSTTTSEKMSVSGFDPRNVLMIDFIEIGRSRKTGKNSFEVCFELACRRFGVQ